jgi:hypothetical protein
VRPSAVPVLLAATGLLFASLVLGSLLPDSLAFLRTVCWRAALLAGVLAWIAFAYQVGRLSFVWEAALACLLVLAGALLVDAQVAEDAVGTAFAITVLTSLVPAALAGFALLLRKWIGREMPRPDVHPHAPPPPPPTAL